MDYLDALTIQRHVSFEQFEAWRGAQAWFELLPPRLILLSTKAAVPYTEFAFRPGDILLAGREWQAFRMQSMPRPPIAC